LFPDKQELFEEHFNLDKEMGGQDGTATPQPQRAPSATLMSLDAKLANAKSAKLSKQVLIDENEFYLQQLKDQARELDDSIVDLEQQRAMLVFDLQAEVSSKVPHGFVPAGTQISEAIHTIEQEIEEFSEYTSPQDMVGRLKFMLEKLKKDGSLDVGNACQPVVYGSFGSPSHQASGDADVFEPHFKRMRPEHQQWPQLQQVPPQHPHDDLGLPQRSWADHLFKGKGPSKSREAYTSPYGMPPAGDASAGGKSHGK